MTRVRATAIAVVAAVLALVSAVVVAAPVEAQISIRINEAVTSNSGGLQDSYGSTPDWIELYNPTSATRGLAGWSLSDDPTVPAKWVFPAGSVIGSGDYLIIFASDTASAGGELHASFKLASAGETIALFDPDGVRVSELAVPAIPTNHSWGIGSNGPELFATPTPNKANGSGSAGFVPDVEVTPGRGFYTAAIQVSLASPVSGTQIRYTLDDTKPTSSTGTVYSGPFTISETTVLRVAAFRNGWVTGEPSTHTYVFPDDVAGQSVLNPSWVDTAAEQESFRDGLLDLPTISIVTKNSISQTSSVQTSVEWIEPEGGPGFQVDSGIHEVGAHATGYPKDSWRLVFNSDFGEPKLEFPVFNTDLTSQQVEPVTSFKRLTLRTGSHDTFFYSPKPSWIRNRWGDETMLELGHVNPHGRYVNVFFNGEYWGQYHVREHFDDHFMASYFGGDNEEFVGINRGAVTTSGSTAGWAEVSASVADWARFRNIVEPVGYVDWMIINEYQGNYWDLSVSRNWRGAGPATTDTSRSKFLFHGSDQDITLQEPTHVTKFPGPGSSWSQLRSQGHVDFVQLVNDRAYALLTGDGALTAAAAVARWDRLTDQISASIYGEHARWAKSSVTPTDWAQDIAYTRDQVIPARVSFTWQRLNSYGLISSVKPPTVATTAVPLGAPVSISNPNSGGEIWVTTDGSDPRAEGGSVASGARVVGSVLVDRPIDLTARVRSGTSWSAPLAVRLTPSVHADGPQVVQPPNLTTMVDWSTNFWIEATDPGGDDLTYRASGLPAGLSIDRDSGAITGRATSAATTEVVVVVSDGTHQSAVYFDWTTIPGSSDQGVAVVLNEYNAVSGAELLGAGQDPMFGAVLGNGGDWFELLVTDEGLDMRGWQIELWDRDDPADALALKDTIVMSNHDLLDDVAAGTMITVRESGAEDLSYDPHEKDWSLQIRSATGAASVLLTGAAGNFDTNRHGFRIRVLDRDGNTRSPFMGETDQWRSRGGNVAADETMALCSFPSDPVVDEPTDYRGQAESSTFGGPNRCGEAEQRLEMLQRGFRGDLNCDAIVDIVDALLVSQVEVKATTEVDSCRDRVVGQARSGTGDFSGDGRANIVDALFIAQCSVGVVNDHCH